MTDQTSSTSSSASAATDASTTDESTSTPLETCEEALRLVESETSADENPQANMDQNGVHVSIVVPTYGEAENLPVLVPKVHAILTEAGLTHEIIVVDDNSPDNTVEVCEELSRSYPLTLEVRTKERGLSTAVIHGMNLAQGEYLVCMDADLSHPAETIPDLVEALRSGGDFVIGSRYVPGGSTAEDWGVFRWLNSKIATWIARPLTRAKDPMAGFFGLSKETFDGAAELDPIGYKIGLELMVKGGCKEVREVPIHFSNRLHGESKLSLKEQLNYLRHVKKLFDYRYGGWAQLLQMGVVGASGMVIDLLIYWLALFTLANGPARAVAIGVAMTWNFFLNRQVTFAAAERRGLLREYIGFCACCGFGALTNWVISVWLVRSVEYFSQYKSLAAIVGIAAGFLFNFLFCRLFVFKSPKRVKG